MHVGYSNDWMFRPGLRMREPFQPMAKVARTVSRSFGKLMAFLILSLAMIVPAQAQFTLEIGMSRDKAVRKMVDQGYTQIEVTRKGMTTLSANACLNGLRYEVRVSDGYRIRNQKEIGVCRRAVTAASIEQNLTNKGFTRIVIDNQNGNLVAIACRNENRVRITYSRQGEVLQRRKIGTCEEIFQPNDVRKVLRDAGYNRIKFTDRQLPWYKAEACRNGNRLELLLTRFGDIRKRTRIGDCSRPINPDQLNAVLEEKGYNRVEILNRRPPIYQVAACFNADRVDLEVDRFGTVVGRKVIGRCAAQMEQQQIVDLLRKEGFRRIEVSKRSNGSFDISACFEGREKFATLSQFGELLSERDGERCRSRSLADISKSMTSRGFSEVEFFTEACRNGRKFRIKLDRRGDRIGRERIGSC